jgi:hypothetical protein
LRPPLRQATKLSAHHLGSFGVEINISFGHLSIQSFGPGGGEFFGLSQHGIIVLLGGGQRFCRCLLLCNLFLNFLQVFLLSVKFLMLGEDLFQSSNVNPVDANKVSVMVEMIVVVAVHHIPHISDSRSFLFAPPSKIIERLSLLLDDILICL